MIGEVKQRVVKITIFLIPTMLDSHKKLGTIGTNLLICRRKPFKK